MARTAAKPVTDEAGVEVIREDPALTEIEVQLIAEAKKVNLEEHMRLWLAQQPKRRIKIRKDLGDAGDVFVSINGYRLLVQRGVELDVPEPVAVILQEGDYI